MADAPAHHTLTGDRIARASAPWTRRGGRFYWWLRLWGWAFLVYTGLVVLTTIQNAVAITHEGLAVSWPLLVTNRVLEEYSCAVFVPALFLLVQRYPLDRAHWRRSTPTLLAATAGFVVVKYLLMEPIFQLLFPQHAATVGTSIADNLLAVMIDFWSVIAVAQAIRFHRHAQERERIAVELRERLTHAQLEALRAQLQPHFLFNTLNGAATLMHSNPTAADRMLTQLSDLLRTTLTHSGTQEIPLGEELDLVERYLAIMRVRFGDRLTVVTDVGDDARAALVPPFLLQPLVENALKHGLAARPGRGRVEIRAADDGPYLRITVADDGPGLTGEGVATGIGLANTRARLAQLYGADQTLTLGPAGPAGGTRVTVILPRREAQPADAEDTEAA